MIQLTGALGAIFAGLFILWTRGMPLLTARRTGVLISKSHNAAKIEREVDAARFDNLMRERARTLVPAAIAVLVGVLLLAQFIWFVGETERRAQLPNPYLDAPR